MANTLSRQACLVLWAATGWLASDARGASEESQFFDELPYVITVSRLKQPLSDVPGAVTVIDRDTIRLSGARNIVDLFRLVPGFQVSNSFEGGAPILTYHGALGGDTSNRMQVLIDGRAVYSPFFLGNIAFGLQAVALDDVERIEVLRGSNSAAYGARAFLGVVNIITRDPGATHGVSARVTSGENGINDNFVRLGWGSENADVRLSANRRGDAGLDGAHGQNVTNNFDLRADYRLGLKDGLQFRLGDYELNSGKGFLNTPANAQRATRQHTSYIQADWRHAVSSEEDILVSASHTDESYADNFPIALPPPFFGTKVDSGGDSRNDSIGLQHSFISGGNLRFVWGGELRTEQVRSQPLFATDTWLSDNFQRLFGHLEWRITDAWILNAGAMQEHSSVSGTNFSPRAMFNWHAAPGHTVRFGVSKAFRPPTLFEKSANVRYVVNNVLLEETFVARGNVRPEKLTAAEIGYLGEIRPLGLSADVRAFRETLNGFINRTIYALPPGTKVIPPQQTRDFVNAENFYIQGVEYQLKLEPRRGTNIMLNQSAINIASTTLANELAAPRHSISVALFQRLPADWEFSLIHSSIGSMSYTGQGNLLSPTHRTDVRIGTPFRIGSTHGDVAFVVQNMGSPSNDFLPNFFFKRQAFVSLSLNY